MDKIVLSLYIRGYTGPAKQLIQELKTICYQRIKQPHTLQVIDVLEHPELAKKENILATPTLIRQYPTPVRKVVGDLEDAQQVMLGLDLPCS